MEIPELVLEIFFLDVQESGEENSDEDNTLLIEREEILTLEESQELANE